MVARQSCCGYPNEYVSEMSTPQGRQNDKVKGGRERRLRSDAFRAALRCGADAPDFPSPVGWGNCAALAARSRFVLVVSRLMARRRTVEEVPRWLAKSARASVPSSVSAGGTRAETETRRRQRPRRARTASEERRDSRGFKVRR